MSVGILSRIDYLMQTHSVFAPGGSLSAHVPADPKAGYETATFSSRK